MSGWIKLHRSIKDWEWYDDLNVRLTFLHCLVEANFKDKSFKGTLFPRGSFPCGRDQLAKDIGITTQQLRTAFNKLKSTGEITTRTTSKGTSVTVCNYDSYQELQPADNQQSNQQVTNNQPASNHSIRKKEGKKVRTFSKPSVEEVSEYGKTRDVNFDEAEKFTDFYESKGWKVGSSPMKDWKATVRNWMRDKNYGSTPSHHTSQIINPLEVKV
jgi:DNA-binding transcriptional regulator YhcF (GntR family)